MKLEVFLCVAPQSGYEDLRLFKNVQKISVVRGQVPTKIYFPVNAGEVIQAVWVGTYQDCDRPVANPHPIVSSIWPATLLSPTKKSKASLERSITLVPHPRADMGHIESPYLAGKATVSDAVLIQLLSISL